jgi:enamine deaminase RidA (YjgF/YER057c/UK114 family)
VFAGRVGESLDFRQGADAAELAALNLLAHLAHAIGDDIRRVEQIVRLGVFIACAPEFTGHAAVANGASDLIVRVLGERGRHARTAIGVASLPGGAAVEIDAIALSCD